MMIWDVVVVGAGPSGSFAAHELARRGRSVLLLERAAFPRWKVCGACLSPGALEVLDTAGLTGVYAGAGVRLRRLVLRTHTGVARISLGESVALSRAVFDAALANAAAGHGAVLWTGARASLGRIERDARVVRVDRVEGPTEVSARVVIDATGLGRGLGEGGARTADAEERSRVGLGAVFAGPQYPIEPGELHMVMGCTGYVGLVRVEDGTLNVAAAVDATPLRASAAGAVIATLLEEAGLPPLGERPLRGWRGTPLLTRSSPDVGEKRLLRVGDAAGYVEPFTGEGMCWALSAGRTAARLAELGVEEWRGRLLEDWRAYRRRDLVPAQRLCRVLAGLVRRPRLVAAGVRALAVAPRLAAPLVERAARAPASWAGVGP